MREPLNTMLETMKSVYGVVVSAAQEKYLNDVDEAYAKGEKSLVSLVSEFVDMFGAQYIDCVPLEVMEKFGFVPNEKEEEKEMAEVKTMASLSGNEMKSVHELTMKAMSSLEPKEDAADEHTKEHTKEHTEEYIHTDEAVNEQAEETKQEEENKPIFKPLFQSSDTKTETVEEIMPSTKTTLKSVDVLDVSEKKDPVDTLVEHLVDAITSPAPLPDDVVVPIIEYKATDPVENENYKLIPVSWLHKHEYNVSYLKNMIITLGRLVGIEASYDNRESIEKVYTKICKTIKDYDLLDFDINKHKEQIEVYNHEIENLRGKQAELLEECSRLRTEKASIIPSEPIGQYVISLSIQSKTYYISNVDEKSGLMVTSHLKKAASYNQLSDALSVLDYLVQHADDMKLKQDILATIEVKQLGLCKV